MTAFDFLGAKKTTGKTMMLNKHPCRSKQSILC